MAKFVGVDAFLIRENQVWNFKVEITNFRSLFRTGIISATKVIKLRSYICTYHSYSSVTLNTVITAVTAVLLNIHICFALSL
jgi:hypothetical protein